MKTITIVFLNIIFVASAYSESACSTPNPNFFAQWKDMEKECITGMKRGIQMEINASTYYLTMGTYFLRDLVYRPGFAKMFFNLAKQKRDIGRKLISYLLIRGELTGEGPEYDEVTNLIEINSPLKTEWENGVDAFQDILQLEVSITRKTKDLINTCKSRNQNDDYNLVNYLSGEFLEQQYHKQRELAGIISELKKMNDGMLGEFVYDKKLME